MNRTVPTSTLLCLLLASFLTGLSFHIQPVKATGTIYIRADGSIQPSNASISSFDNITYILTDNINDEIVIERSNITIDGEGHRLYGLGSGRGFNLTGVNNVTIQNTEIQNYAYGIWLSDSLNSTVSGNKITNNYEGVYIYGSSGITVSGNNAASNYDGIWLEESSGITVSRTNVTNNYHGISLRQSLNNTISGNKITANYYYGIDMVGSSGNTISGNNVTNNDCGIWFLGSSNCTVSGNNVTNNYLGIRLSSSSNNTLRNNNASDNEYNFSVDGHLLSDYVHDVDDSNTVDGKPIYYRVNRRDMTVPLDAGYVALVNCTNITLTNIMTTKNLEGVLLAFTTNSTITKNNITNNWYGIQVYCSSGNTISENEITATEYGSNFGIKLSGSSNNTISGNKITNNEYAIALQLCSDNLFFHNNLMDNIQQVYMLGVGGNFWDNGLEGNYWSDYTSGDIDNDGIGNFPYVIDDNNKDNHPLMGMFSEFSVTARHNVQTICNSTISDFKFNGTAFCFNVAGVNGTIGFCRMCIPRALINATFKVFVNGTEVECNPLTEISNITHSFIYFTYNHSVQEVVVITVFPEFLILTLFMMATLSAVIVYKREYLF